jgi:hypothetical protein
MNATRREPAASSPASRASVWSLELALVIALPLTAVAASLITLAIAFTHPWQREAQDIDRWGHPVVKHETVKRP